MAYKALAEELTALLGAENVSTRRADREAASRDESDMQPTMPALVVWPESTEDVMMIVGKCRESRVPLTARGAGSSLEGNPIPVRGGLVLDLSRMNELIEVRPGDLLCRVEPGIVYNDLNAKLRKHGLFFPTSPGGSADVATIGGMVANNASGIYALKYGGTRRAVLGLTAVTGAGEVIRTGHQCPKSSAGYDLTSLLVGSEGTLAIVTEVTLSLTGRPAASRKLGYTFDDERACAAAIAELIGYGVDLAACEYLDAKCMRALNQFKDYGLPELPGLFLEVHAGSDGSTEEIVEIAEAVVKGHGAKDLPLAGDPWALRHWATRAVRGAHPGTATIRADVAFPISLLPEAVDLAHSLAAREGVNLYAFGHAGLGILHLLIQESPEDFVRWEAATDVKDHVVEFVVDRGGTCSGEHGVGLGNKGYMQREHGMAVEVMARVKKAFDPDGILNPGKILP